MVVQWRTDRLVEVGSLLVLMNRLQEVFDLECINERWSAVMTTAEAKFPCVSTFICTLDTCTLKLSIQEVARRQLLLLQSILLIIKNGC